MSTTVMLVDDSSVVRVGLRALLETEPDIEVVAEAADGHEALALADKHTPDVVLLDVRMPNRDGLSVVGELAADAVVIMMTFTDEPAVIHRALAAGAAGYLVHGTFDASSLAHLVRGAAAGLGAFSGTALGALQDAARVGDPGARTAAAPEHGLSSRQIEVMELIAKGRSNGAIAQELFLAEKTVKNHINQIFATLGVATRAEAIALWLGSAGQPLA